MKTIGIIGGMSWESSAEYYRQINEAIKARLGSTRSAELVMYSMDFHPIAQLELEERWDELTQFLIGAVTRVEKAGADFVILASNTVHKVAEHVRGSTGIPLLHIADATAEEIGKAGIRTVGLLGTRFVMEQDFYKERFRSSGINVRIRDRNLREFVQTVIYEELCAGKIIPESRYDGDSYATSGCVRRDTNGSQISETSVTNRLGARRKHAQTSFFFIKKRCCPGGYSSSTAKTS